MLALSAFCIKYTPPALSIETILNFFFIFEFYRRNYFRKIVFLIKIYHLRVFYCLSFISIVLSGVYSIMSFSDFFLRIVLLVINDYVIAFMFWIVIDNKEKIRFFIRYCISVFSFACIFGFIELIFNTNLYVEFLYDHVNRDLLDGKFYDVGERLGMRRVLSLFVSPNNFIYGAFISIMCFYFNYKSSMKSKIKYGYLFVYLTVIMILLANSRTVLVSSLVIMLPIFFLLKKQNRWLFFICFVIFIFPLYRQFESNILSVFSLSDNNAIEGSSVSGRMMQFAGSYELFLRSPIVGNGLGSIDYFISDNVGYKWIILGTESIWMKLMIERGIIGIVSYLVLFIELFKRYNMRNSILFFTVVGYLVAHTMSSLPGFNLSFIIITIICINIIENEKKNRHIINAANS
jgi:hypothetical protein